MKLGIFDSGLGGLLITRAVREAIPDMDILYYGDTLHLPYGNRSEEAIYMYTRRSMEFMFDQGCKLIVVACNTASATALRRMQMEWLPEGAYPGRNIIGVVVPTLEAAIEKGHKRLGLIGTNYLVRSDVYKLELTKLSPGIEIHQQATPLLVPLIENDGMNWAQDVLAHYLVPLLAKDIECLMLACTHYPFLKAQIRAVVGNDIQILSQDEIIPAKLTDYLRRHPEYAGAISRNGRSEFFVSDVTDNYRKSARVVYGHDIELQKVKIAA